LDGLLLGQPSLRHIVVEVIALLLEERLVRRNGLVLVAIAEMMPLIHLLLLHAHLCQRDRLIVLTQHRGMWWLTVAVHRSLPSLNFLLVEVGERLFDFSAHIYSRFVSVAGGGRHSLYHFSQWLHLELGARRSWYLIFNEVIFNERCTFFCERRVEGAILLTHH